MIKKYIIPIAILMSWSALSAEDVKAPKTAEPKPEQSLEQSLMRLSSAHPRVLRSARLYAAALERARYSRRVYPDPKVGLYWLNAPYKKDLRFLKDKTPMTGVEFRFTQAIPFPGRLTLESKIQDAQARIERLRLAREKNGLAADYLTLLLERRLLSETLKLARSYTARIKVTYDAARTKYSVGRGNLADVARADLRYRAYQERVVKLEGLLKALDKRYEYFQIKGEESRPPAGPALTAYLEKLAREAPGDGVGLKDRSLLAAIARAQGEKSRRTTTLAKMEYLPDMDVYAAYRRRAYIESDPVRGEDMMSFGVTLRIPLWSALAKSNQVKQRKHEERSSRFEEQDVIGRERSLYGAARAKTEMFEERLKMYGEKLLPSARRARDSARLSYQTGKVDFDVFLNSWDALFMLEAEELRLRVDRDRQVILMNSLNNTLLPEFKHEQKGGPK